MHILFLVSQMAHVTPVKHARQLDIQPQSHTAASLR
jgi:hypothetical protein